MKAIETEYKGYKFRSRLEARWAVFLDVLREPWEYEVQGYDLDDGDLYLPDFWLPRLNMHLEIKGTQPNEDEIRKCRKLQYHTGDAVMICYGTPMTNPCTWFCFDSGPSGGGLSEWEVQWGWEDELVIVMASLCSVGHTFFTKQWDNTVKVSQDWESRDALKEAADCAKRARFEYGETPELCDIPSRILPSVVDYESLPF